MKNNNFDHPDEKSTALVVVDIQERLVRAMNKMEISGVIEKSQTLIVSCLKLGIPVIITEQYPKGLGSTVEELKSFLHNSEIFEKTSFSCFGCENFNNKIKSLNLKSIILCGIETHVCVQQTAFDARKIGLNVFVPADAVSSRNSQNKNISLQLMLSSGIFVTSVESLLFDILRDASHTSFKEISKILR